MKLKVRIVEVLERVVEVEGVSTAKEAAERVRADYKNGDIVLTTDDLSRIDFCSPADKEGVCPVCGCEIEYNYNEVESDGKGSGGTTPWFCPYCGATGKEGYDDVFDGHHYDVQYEDGTPVPGRGAY